MIPGFLRIRSKIEDVNLAQDAVDNVLRVIRKKEIIDGILLENLVLASGTTNQINHGLGVPIRGWIVVRQNANSSIWEAISALPNVILSLNCSVTVTVSLWVF